MGIKMYQADAFTAEPFAGNPAMVCLLEGPAEPTWMQKVAREMNLSETAFLYPQADGYQLRWFTPAAEVDLCGHATLASAHILWETGRLPMDAQARFHTRSGLLSARRRGAWIEMDFPGKPEKPAEPPAALLSALGVSARYVGKNQFDYLVELDTEAEVRRVDPDFGLLKSLPVRGVIVTSRSSLPEYDFVSRFFAPAVGVNEDPVTGSAHTCLGPYWLKHFQPARPDGFVAYQASARGGVIKVRVEGERVLLAGQAVTVLHGELA